jgi:hypothetical protein
VIGASALSCGDRSHWLLRRSIMTRTLWIAGTCLLPTILAGPIAAGEPTLAELARQAVSADAETAQRATLRLREAGPAGLDALFHEHGAAIAAHHREPAEGRTGDPQAWQRLGHALDTVAAQYDAHATCLYWHTSLDTARAAAAASGRPILSLRLLGRLDEECSCANSRFFRAVLYANADIGKMLRDQFVLHWQSVRPVPKVTIDFGDGRKLVRTLTGNSIHYVLDAEGRPVDALPGLYGPSAFRQRLEAAQQAVRSLAASGETAVAQGLRSYHAREHARIVQQWRDDLKKCGIVLPEPVPVNAAVAGRPQTAKQPTARAAAELAVTKRTVELPLVNAAAATVETLSDPRTAEPLARATTEEVWKKIAALHAEEARLDAASVALIRQHTPTALQAADVARGKGEVEAPLLRMIARFQQSIALDTVRNEYLIHRRLHQWFLTGEAVTRDVDQLNQRVYAELFLTPDSDPWLGLVTDEVYTGLKDHGIVPAAVGKQ